VGPVSLMKRLPAAVVLVAALCAMSAAAPSVQGDPISARDYPMFNLDPMRSGVNAAEHVVTPGTVGKLVSIWSTQLSSVADESVIELADVGPKRAPNLLYITTLRGVTYALNAANGAIVWTYDPHDDNLPDAQITTATPAADPSRAWIYAASPDGRIHKLEAATGKEATGWPVAVTLHPQDEKIASALNVVDGYVLETTSGYIGDAGHYDGHMVAVNTTTGKLFVFNSLCSDYPGLFAESASSGKTCPNVQSGMWARSGTVVDQMNASPTKGSIFAVTGNGDYNGSTNWGDTVLRLALGGHGLVLTDAYTPSNFDQLDSQDLDLGSTAPILLPRQSGAHPWLAVQGGKDGYLRVIDRADMSGRGKPGHPEGELAQFQIPQGGHMPTAGLAWKDDSGGTWVFYATDNGVAGVQVRVVHGAVTLRQVWLHKGTYSSPLLAGGVLYVAESGALRAFDPKTGRALWSSDRASARRNIKGVHWESPTVINGRVYMPDHNGVLTAYGLP
jgi:outer membrane protein assembly factor BamB